MRLVIADNRLESSAKASLEKIAKVIWFETKDICYESISGHPDIFFCQIANTLVVAPNCPQVFIEQLHQHKVNFVFGYTNVGAKFPETVSYNALANSKYLIHNLKYTDKKILELADLHKLEKVNVNQAYTRCTSIALDNNQVISSDEQISKKLRSLGFEMLEIKTQNIKIGTFNYGFIGGCAGTFNNNIVFTARINKLELQNELILFCNKHNYQIIELNSNDLYDGGGLVFIPN